MLSPDFLDWWFAPWTYAANVPSHLELAQDYVGQRDGYRMWCEEARIGTNLPAQFDPSWHTVIPDSGEELLATAQLFAGLIAAREHNQEVLAKLAFADRKWCVSIAATQPLSGSAQIPYKVGESAEVRGLMELARRLEHGFPGLWARLRLMLPKSLAERTEKLLQATTAAGEKIEASPTRAQRCWLLCQSRIATYGIPPSLISVLEENAHSVYADEEDAEVAA